MPAITSTTRQGLTVLSLKKNYYLKSFNQTINLKSLGWQAIPGNSENIAAFFPSGSSQALIDLATSVGTDSTVEMKLRLNAATNDPVGVVLTSTNQGFNLHANQGIFTGVRYYNGSTNESSGSVIFSFSSAWATMAIVRENTTWRFYVSYGGATMSRLLQDTLPVYAQSTGYNRLWIGQTTFPTTNPMFAGIIESIRVSNIARYADSSVTTPERLDSDANTVDLIKII